MLPLVLPRVVLARAGAGRGLATSALELVQKELAEQRAQLRRQEELLTQLLIRLAPRAGEGGALSAAAAAAAPPPPALPPKQKSPRGFLDFARHAEPYRPAKERHRDWEEIARAAGHADPLEQKRQAARCMDCGTPFCQTHTGCPINNLIPEWNELVLTDRWKEAIVRLHATNNFPEFTGRVCPAPCEGSCVAGVNSPDEAVTIKNIEYAIVDRAFKEGWIQPRPVSEALRKKGKSVAVVGSGPAGLAAADILNQLGHRVTVFERSDRVGGLLMYGIPTMKLSKNTVDRRVNLLREEGVAFVTNAQIQSPADLAKHSPSATTAFDATLLAVGASRPRDLPVPGRSLNGIYFAMDFLTRSQKDLAPDKNGLLKSKWGEDVVSVRGKNVVVIGGGDTGTDCIGTSLRQYCKSIVNLEVMPEPPATRSPDNPWPQWPKIFRTDYGHAEVAAVMGRDPRRFALMTRKFLPDASKKNVRAIAVVSVEPDREKGGLREVPGTEHEIQADVVILAMGFLGVEREVATGFGLEEDARGNIKAGFGSFSTSVRGVFAAGDCRRGQSLVVWGIREGRDAASKIDQYLKGL